jgi:hypothetical protein
MTIVSDILRNLGGIICCILFDILVLNNRGAFSSVTNLHNEGVLLDKKKYHFYWEHICDDIDREKYLSIVDKIQRLDIFAYKVDNAELKTMIHKKNELVKQDDLVAITTSLVPDRFFITSYEKIAVLEETENTFILCMTTCSENLLNGYYRFQLKYNVDDKKLDFKYSKVQTFSTLPAEMILQLFREMYIEVNKVSISNTINYLLNDTTYTSADVGYHYS